MQISAVIGEDHKRHRRILLPGFGGPETRAFLNVFKGCAESVSLYPRTHLVSAYLDCNTDVHEVDGNNWEQYRPESRNQCSSLAFPRDTGCDRSRYNLHHIRSKCISHFPIAAFDVQFGAIKDDSHPLVKVYKNFLSVLWHLLCSLNAIVCCVQE